MTLARKFVALLLVLILTSGAAIAGDKTWVGAAGGLWSTDANWSPTGKPGAGDDVIFNVTTNTNSTLDATFALKSLTIQNGFTATITANATGLLNISGGAGLTQDGGLIDLTLGASFTMIKPSFTLTSGTTKLSQVNSFGALIINGGTLDAGPATDLIIDSFAQTAGTFTAAVGETSVKGNWQHSGGVFNPNASLIYFQAATTFSIDAGGAAGAFNDVNFQTPAACTLVNSDMVVNGSFDMNYDSGQTGSFSANGKNLTVGDVSTIVAGTFIAGSGAITFNNSLDVGGSSSLANAPLNGALTCGSGTFNVKDFNLKGSGAATNGIGTLTLGTGPFNVSGKWTRTPALTPPIFNRGTSTVSFTAATGMQTITSGASAIPSATDGRFFGINHSGAGTLKLLDDTTVLGTLTNSAGTFDCNGTTLSALAGFTNSGTFLISNGFATFDQNVNLNGGTLTGSLNFTNAIAVNADTSIGSGTQQLTLATTPGTPCVITVATGSTLNVTSIISGAFSKAGPGKMIVAAPINANGNPTSVSGGILEVDGMLSGTSTAANGGGTIIGTGTVPQLTVAAGAIVNPGTGNGGKLTSTANVTFVATSVFKADITGTTAAQFSSLSTGGPVDLGNATLTVAPTAGLVAPFGTIFKIIDNTGAGKITGTFAGLPEGAAITTTSRLFVISYVGGDGNDVTLTVQNTPPTFTSAATATPNPALVNDTITFSAAATDLEGTTVTYTWDFGDSTSVSGASVTHAYTTGSTYNAKVTASDGSLTTVSTVAVLVSYPLAVGQGVDSDGDGFSDAFELAAGSSPNNPASTPTGGPAAAGSIGALTISKTAIKLNFAKTGADSITVSGTLNIPAGFAVANQKVTIDVGGVDIALVLSSKGAAKVGGNSFKLPIKAKKGVVAAQTAKYTAAFAKGTFAAQLADEGLTGTADAKNVSKTVVYTLVFNGTILQKSQTVTYTAKKGKTGAAK